MEKYMLSSFPKKQRLTNISLRSLAQRTLLNLFLKLSASYYSFFSKEAKTYFLKDQKVSKKSLAKRCCQRAPLKFKPPFIRLKFQVQS
jgi:hypothetical protein